MRNNSKCNPQNITLFPSDKIKSEQTKVILIHYLTIKNLFKAI